MTSRFDTITERNRQMSPVERFNRRHGRRRATFAATATLALFANFAHAQDRTESRPAGNPAPAPVAVATAPSADQAPVQEVPPAPSPMTSLFGNMKLQGYSDVSFGTPLQEKLPVGGLQASKYSFQIADLHLFMTSRLSSEWSFLSELLITSDFSNEFAAELDRLLIQYSPNKHLRVGFGKFNSGVGYYPDEFHRAKFFQVASGRPIMFSDEDNGGILALHQVGVTAQGEIPSGSLGLHYLGEISNGRSFHEGSAEIQNWSDSNNLKAVNVGLFARPDFAPGL